MNKLDLQDKLSFIELDLRGLASMILSLAEAPHMYDLPIQLEMLSHFLDYEADQLNEISGDR